MSSTYDELADALELKLLKDQKVERLDDSEFILEPHQVFVERFFSPENPNRYILMVNYQMGTGKTLAAVELISKLVKKYEFIRRCNTGSSNQKITLPIPYVVGAWSTILAFESEFFRPKFGIVSEGEYNRLQLLLEEGKYGEYEEMSNILKKRLKKHYKAYSYQKLFNLYFKGSLTLPSKTKTDIYKAIKNKTIYVNSEIEKNLSNSILVIDEAQLMYSRNGLNTYGIMLEHIMQNPNISNMILVLLSGTFINSSPVELVYLANLIRKKGYDEFKVSDYFTQEAISENKELASYTVHKPKENVQNLLNNFQGKVASYSTPLTSDYPSINQIGEKLTIRGTKFKWLKLYRCRPSLDQWLEYETSTSKKEQKEENLLIYNEDRLESIIGKEKNQLSIVNEAPISLDTNHTLIMTSLEEDQREEPKARDFLIPTEEDIKKYGISRVPGMEDIFTGAHLKIENLEKRFGIIPAMFLKRNLEIWKTGRREKILVYHRNTRKGGLFQYAEAFKENGYVELGTMPRNYSICYECLKAYSDHRYKNLKDMPEGLQDTLPESFISLRQEYQKEKPPIKSHHFKPISFILMTGELENIQRSELLSKYQSLSNIDGENIMILGISSIGERAITIKECNHIYYLSSIPGIPLWQQIGSRVARMGTHVRLPPERRRVDVITMSLAPPEELEKKKEPVISRDEIRYLIREIEHEITVKLWNIITRGTVNCPIVDHPKVTTPFSSGHIQKCDWDMKPLPSRYPLSTSTQLHYNKNYYQMDVEAVKYILSFILKYESPIITLKDLRMTILNNEKRKVPWNTSFTSNEAICEGIYQLIKDGVCHLVSSEKVPPRIISPKLLEKETVMLIANVDRARENEPSTDPFLSPIETPQNIKARTRSIWKPLNVFSIGDSNIQSVISIIEKKKGYRERLNMLSSIITKPEIIPAIYNDYVRKGVIYEILLKEGSIVWEGDPTELKKFVINRLNWLDKKYGKPIGVILGPYFFKDNGKSFDRIDIPFNSTSGQPAEISLLYSSGTELQPGKWHVRTRIKKLSPIAIEDKRKEPRGMACFSIEREILIKYLRELGDNSKPPERKNDLCEVIERRILEKELKGGTKRYVWSYFDKK